MKQTGIVKGFSRFSRMEKLDWIREAYGLSAEGLQVLDAHLHPEKTTRELYAKFSENTVAEFHLPFGLAPNFLINDRFYLVPMVIEESSVVAAASHAARFWALQGGFHCEVPDMLKTGQVHFTWRGDPARLEHSFQKHQEQLLESVGHLTSAMEARGGGIHSMELSRTSPALKEQYQLFLQFRTSNAMGANFINSVLEALAEAWVKACQEEGISLRIDMSILSNYTPECRVLCRARAPVKALAPLSKEMDPLEFAEKMVLAFAIAREDRFRAVTHNKGILNGMDAVIMATGNDYRAVEAGVHAYASRDGSYGSLSRAWIEQDILHLELEVPLALGTVGGLTSSHPLAALSLELLGHPDARELMMITAAAGLANNFSAVRALVTTGIQQGHMKMHLENILQQLQATPREAEAVRLHVEGRTLSHAAVKAFLEQFRKGGHA